MESRTWRSAAQFSFAPSLIVCALLAGCSSPVDAEAPRADEAAPPRQGASAAMPTSEEEGTDETDEGAKSAHAFFPRGKFVDPGDPVTPPTQGPYAYLDPTHLVPTKLLDRAVAFFDANKAIITNKDFLTVVDFSVHSGTQRFFVIDMASGVVEPYVVAHGKMSDPNYTGYATSFSNVSGSNMSSLGFAVTGDTYYGIHGRSLRLEGLSPTNSNMLSRAIVIHGASYVVEGQAKQGRSLGCFALDETEKDDVIDMLEGGSLLYADLGS
jgi:hypothetical protein